jgi:hypothetical protein
LKRKTTMELQDKAAILHVDGGRLPILGSHAS